MSISMHSAAVPMMKTLLGALSGVLDADELVQRIASGVDRHTGSLHQRDDLTLLCVGVEHLAALRAAA